MGAQDASAKAKDTGTKTIRVSRRAASWVAASPADRGVVPLGIAAAVSAPVLHALAVPTPDVIAAGGILPLVTSASIYAATRSGPTAAKAAAGTILTGAWLAAASRWGLLAGPDHITAILGAAGAVTGYAVMHADGHLRERRRQRAHRSRWHRAAAAVGLGGSDLMHHTRTRLGERLELDTRGTGQLASRLAGTDVAERFAELRGLPAGRVTVTPGRIAGRLEVSIRSRDPWEKPILHPLLDPSPEIAFPETATIAEPLVVGQDPETGEPLTADLYGEEGTRVMLIVAQKGGGKTVLLNNLTERATACADAVVWSINVSKAQEDRAWAPAFGLAAAGPADRVRALWILRLAEKVIEYRGNIPRDSAVFRPSPQAPLVVLRIDEAHALFRIEDDITRETRMRIATIASTCRSEGVVLKLATQRGTTAQVGGGDVRANADLFAFMRTRGSGEMQHAAGDVGLDLPSIAKYGEGHPGVTLITGHDGDYSLGRTFLLADLDKIRRIAATRTPPVLEPGLAEHLGDAYQILLAGETPPLDPSEAEGAPWLEEADREVMAGIAPDLKARLAAINQRSRAMLDGPAPAPRVPAQRADIPDRVRGALEVLLRSENGVSVRRAASLLAVSESRAHSWLSALRDEGTAEVRGAGRGAAFYATAPGTFPAAPCARGETFPAETFQEESR